MPVLSEPKASLSTRLAERLPEILIEAASVVFALLLALALNQWNERRELRERGAAVRAAIRAELSENRLEIDSARVRRHHGIGGAQLALDQQIPEFLEFGGWKPQSPK